MNLFNKLYLKIFGKELYKKPRFKTHLILKSHFSLANKSLTISEFPFRTDICSGFI